MTPSEYDLLDLRTETLGSDEQRQAFYDRLEAFLASYSNPRYLHALTSFSLPEGRDPAGTDLWVFLAFEGHNGHLSQTSIEVSSPETGEVIFNYGVSESVPSAGGDHRVVERAAIGDDIAQEIRAQILTTEGLDRFRLSEKINDPEQTLVRTCPANMP